MINNLSLMYRGCQQSTLHDMQIRYNGRNKRAKIEGEPTFLKERKQGSADLVTCGKCSGFYSRKKLQQHKGICAGNIEVTGNNVSMPVSSQTLPSNNTIPGRNFRTNIKSFS